MKAVVQRVTRASVSVEGQTIGQIERGLLVLLGLGKGDTMAEADCLFQNPESPISTGRAPVFRSPVFLLVDGWLAGHKWRHYVYRPLMLPNPDANTVADGPNEPSPHGGFDPRPCRHCGGHRSGSA